MHSKEFLCNFDKFQFARIKVQVKKNTGVKYYYITEIIIFWALIYKKNAKSLSCWLMVS